MNSKKERDIFNEVYPNDGEIAVFGMDDEIEILGETYSPGETLWYKVRTADGETGWLLG